MRGQMFRNMRIWTMTIRSDENLCYEEECAIALEDVIFEAGGSLLPTGIFKIVLPKYDLHLYFEIKKCIYVKTARNLFFELIDSDVEADSFEHHLYPIYKVFLDWKVTELTNGFYVRPISDNISKDPQNKKQIAEKVKPEKKEEKKPKLTIVKNESKKPDEKKKAKAALVKKEKVKQAEASEKKKKLQALWQYHQAKSNHEEAEAILLKMRECR